MIPNEGSSAEASRNPSEGVCGTPVASCRIKITTKAAASPMKLQGSASRTAATNASSPTHRIAGTARFSNDRKTLEAADDGFDATDDLDIARVDWRHRLILRLEPHPPCLTIEAFHRRFAVEHRDHDLAIFGAALRADQNQIPVENGGIHHRLSLNPKHDPVRSPRHESGPEEKLAFDIFLGRDRDAGRNATEHWKDNRFFSGRKISRAQRAGLGRIARDQAVTLERLQVGVNRRGRGETHALSDLADGGRVAVIGGKVADDLQNSPLPLRGRLLQALLTHRTSQSARRMPTVWHPRPVQP